MKFNADAPQKTVSISKTDLITLYTVSTTSRFEGNAEDFESLRTVLLRVKDLIEKS